MRKGDGAGGGGGGGGGRVHQKYVIGDVPLNWLEDILGTTSIVY